MSTGRYLRPLLVASLGLVALAPGLGANAVEPSGADLAGCDNGRVTIRDDHWVRIAPPPTEGTDDAGTIRAFDAPPREAGRIYITDGTTVRVSRDGGCKWDLINPPDDAAAPDPIPNVYTHVAAAGRNGLWLTGYNNAGGVPSPIIRRTPNATPAPGNTTTTPYETTEVGLPAVGTPVHFAVSQVEADKDSAFLLLEQPPDATTGDVQTPTRHLYRTKVDDLAASAGLPRVTWQEVAAPQGFGRIEGMTGSPANSRQIWIWSGQKWATTVLIGDQFQWVTGSTPEPIVLIDVTGAGLATVYSRSGESALAQYVTPEGKVSDSRVAPVVPVSATHGTRQKVYAVSGKDKTFGWDIDRKKWVDVTPKGVPSFGAMRIARGAVHGILFGQTPEALYRFDLYPHETFLPPPPGPKVVEDPNAEVEFPESDLDGTVMTPKTQAVTVAPGEYVDAPVDFGVGPKPTPLDVFFIIDTTNSMDPAIRGLKAGVKNIASQLTKRLGKKVCIGLGDVKDYRPQEQDKVYRLSHPVADCSLERLQKAVDKLEQGGGDTQEAEAQTLALVQAVTGSGVTEPPVIIPRGLDAKFRTDVQPFKVIVLISDAAVKETGPYPSIDTVVRELNAHDVEFVGVVAQTQNDYDAAREDMEQIALGTETLAPKAGVDCDGNGKPDIQHGDPLVCMVENAEPNLAPAILRLLLGVPDKGLLGVEFADPHKVVHHVTGTTSELSNLKIENHVKVTPTLTCSPEQDGLDLSVSVVGQVKGVPANVANIIVRCRAIPIPPPPIEEPPFIPEEPVPRIVLAPVPIAEIPVPVFQNPPGPPGPNAGLSHEEEQQFQIAAVTQGSAEEQEEEESEIELAMSRISHGDAASSTLVFGGAALITGVGAYAVGQRRRSSASVAVRPAYDRPRRRRT